MKAMADYIEKSCGGAGKGWLQIAYSPEEARQIITDNRLAVILGVEVDSLGNWRSVDDLEQQSGGDLNEARRLIGAELDWLHGLGIRQITPIHLTNNAFGGTAIYLRFLETVNVFVTGERWSVQDAWKTGVRYRLDHDGVDAFEDFERTLAVSGPRLRAMHRQTLLDHIPGIRNLYEAIEAPNIQGGHANTRGLNRFGHILLEEMMVRGFLIDVDHMSEKSTDEALDMVEKRGYPVMCSHTWFRDLLYSAETEFDPFKHEHYGTSDVHKVAHEAGKRGDQIERIGRLGGMVAPILNQGDIAGLKRGLPEQSSKIPEPCAGSSTEWAQAYVYALAKMGGRGVAMGSDINGAAGLPGPRFGTFAAYGVHLDERRVHDRRGEITRQSNGVAYREPLRDHRWHRFQPSGPGGYDEEEQHTWHAIAQYEAGFNPLTQTHPITDFPDRNIKLAMELASVNHWYDWVDRVTSGFFLAESEPLPSKEELNTWPVEQRAAYYTRQMPERLDEIEDERTRELAFKMRAVWLKWNQMMGENPPLVRSFAGPRRDFDINLDGMAHYGMLPDLLQDVRNCGLTPDDLVPLFRSAQDTLEMWSQCRVRAEDLKKAL